MSVLMGNPRANHAWSMLFNECPSRLVNWLAYTPRIVPRIQAVLLEHVAPPASTAPPPRSSAVTLERVGRRTYFVGNTFPIKDLIRNSGGHWDGDRKQWWIGSQEYAEGIVRDAQQALQAAAATPSARYSKLSDDSWGLRGRNLVAGETVEVRKADGTTKTETVASILSTDADGNQIARISVAARKSGGSGTRGRGGRSGRRGTWTGCSCGSVEEYERPNDCASCRHDR